MWTPWDDAWLFLVILMRILVTGVTGQIGAELASRLRKFGTVIAADRTVLDLAQPGSIAKALDRLAPDIVINPAAYTAVDKAEDEPKLAHLVNAVAPASIARWTSARRVPLIHFSTDYVFGGAGERPWREDDAPQPLSAYGASKLAGENEIRAAGGPFLIIRTSWVYAARGKNFLRTITQLARERQELRIVADQIGAPTSAALIAKVATQIIERKMDNLSARFAAVDGLVHVAASDETTWYGFAIAIIQGLRARGVQLAVEQVVPIRTSDYPTRAKRPLNSRLNLGRLQRVFGITPPHWEVALTPELDELSQNV
jgi:dTDP-4-dehydrorhamnose reductase